MSAAASWPFPVTLLVVCAYSALAGMIAGQTVHSLGYAVNLCITRNGEGGAQ
jgi:hypothetical protein